jgi:hypothetical protein
MSARVSACVFQFKLNDHVCAENLLFPTFSATAESRVGDGPSPITWHLLSACDLNSSKSTPKPRS